MMIFFGLYFTRVIGTKVLPKEPVPSVIKIIEFVFLSYYCLDAKTENQGDNVLIIGTLCTRTQQKPQTEAFPHSKMIDVIFRSTIAAKSHK